MGGEKEEGREGSRSLVSVWRDLSCASRFESVSTGLIHHLESQDERNRKKERRGEREKTHINETLTQTLRPRARIRGEVERQTEEGTARPDDAAQGVHRMEKEPTCARGGRREEEGLVEGQGGRGDVAQREASKEGDSSIRRRFSSTAPLISGRLQRASLGSEHRSPARQVETGEARLPTSLSPPTSSLVPPSISTPPRVV